MVKKYKKTNKAKKYAKRTAKAIGKAVVSRYKTGGMGALAADVAVLKRMVNAEKKNVTAEQMSYVNLGIHANATGTVSGHQIIYPQATNPSICPATTKGTGGTGQRIGDSIKASSAYIRFHFRPQTSYTGGGKVTIYLIEKIKDSFVVGTSPISNIFNQDSFFAAYTTISGRNSEFYNQYRIIAKKNVYFPSEQYQTMSDEFHKDVEFKLQFKNRHIKYQPTSDSQIMGNYGAILLANFGNTANNTGVRFIWSSTLYYYDN